MSEASSGLPADTTAHLVPVPPPAVTDPDAAIRTGSPAGAPVVVSLDGLGQLAAPPQGPSGRPSGKPEADSPASTGPRRRRGSRGSRGAKPAAPVGKPKAAAPDVVAVLKPRTVTAPPAVQPITGAALNDTARSVRKPRIGDTRPAPGIQAQPGTDSAVDPAATGRRRRRRGSRGRGTAAGDPSTLKGLGSDGGDRQVVPLDPAMLERRRGKERKGRPVGRYLMCVQVRPEAIQIAVLEGRSLISHVVSKPEDNTSQIHGNVYLGRVQNVLPGMEAAFIDIGTPKNAVLYASDLHGNRATANPDSDAAGTAAVPDTEHARGDAAADSADIAGGSRPGPTRGPGQARIEDVLRPGQMVLCQVTKNPIGTKGARLTQEVSLAGRFVVLVPNSTTYGISKRLGDDERKRLRRILDDVRPPGHGLIVRTAAEGASPEELRRDVLRLMRQWDQIENVAKRSKGPTLLSREPTLAVRVIREEFGPDFRGVIIDDADLYNQVFEYVSALAPELSDRIELYEDSNLALFERQRIHEQLFKALDRKVWLPSGGSLIIERTEALTVIDVNTGRNVGSSNLEETVFANNLEAADEIARQLRLRDIGGIIVIDFIDMEIRKNRDEVVRALREGLARDKTRTQVFDISDLGLVQMTRKRVSEGLVESFSLPCPTCSGRGIILDETLL